MKNKMISPELLSEGAFKVQKLYPDSLIPQKANPTDSGFDVFAYMFEKVYDKLNNPILFPVKDSDFRTKYKMHGIGNYSNMEWTLKTNDRILINTGLSVSVNPGFEIQVRPRSGLALKYGLTVTNTPGTIDCSYRGPLCVIITNTGHENYTIKVGDKIAQIVVCSVCLPTMQIVEDLDETARGSGGFGSTDKTT